MSNSYVITVARTEREMAGGGGLGARLDRLRDSLEESSAIAEIAARHLAPPDR